MVATLRASASLVAQLRIIFSELVVAHPSAGESWTASSAAALQGFGRQYAAEMYLCAQQLRDQESAAPSAEEAAEVRAELQRTLWAVCIWELCVIFFIGRPALLTEALVPWWQLHLCDRGAAEQDLPALEALDAPETSPKYWPTLRALIARGLPEHALRLLKQHSGVRAGAGSESEQLLLERLETLLELIPRLAEPELLQPQREEAPLGQLEQAALQDFKLRHHVWATDLQALMRDANAGAAGGVGSAAEVSKTVALLSGDAETMDEHSEWWHGKLITMLLYRQPTTLRWQVGAHDSARGWLPQGRRREPCARVRVRVRARLGLLRWRRCGDGHGRD